MDVLKLIPLLENYPNWVRIFFLGWFIAPILVLMFAPKNKAEKPDTPSATQPSQQISAGDNSTNIIGSQNTINIGKQEAKEPNVRIETHPDTLSGNFSETKFLITNNAQFPIYKVHYLVEFWDGDIPLGALPNQKKKFVFFSMAEAAKLSPSASMSAKAEMPPIFVIPDTREVVEFHKIRRPYCQLIVTMKMEHDGPDVKIGRSFWAEKSQSGKYIWFPDGESHQFKAADEWPKAK